jgi:hypothetical protein
LHRNTLDVNTIPKIKHHLLLLYARKPYSGGAVHTSTNIYGSLEATNKTR